MQSDIGYAPNVSSWGASILFGDDGQYHLFGVNELLTTHANSSSVQSGLSRARCNQLLLRFPMSACQLFLLFICTADSPVKLSRCRSCGWVHAGRDEARGLDRLADAIAVRSFTRAYRLAACGHFKYDIHMDMTKSTRNRWPCRCIHAVSDTIGGPFLRHDVAVTNECHG